MKKMPPDQFEITLSDEDPHYVGLEICASNSRYKGTTFIYSSKDDLTSFRFKLEGLLVGSAKFLEHKFGIVGAEIGGYCSFRSLESQTDEVFVEVAMSDDKLHFDEADCRLIIRLDRQQVAELISKLKSLVEG